MHDGGSAMNLSAPFIARPVATLLLSLAILLLGLLSFRLLPVAPLPDMDFPVIAVDATLAGASPATMASSVATPLERALGSIAGVDQMSSNSSLGTTRITVQFNLDKDINEAAREVQAAINAARNLLPSGMRSMPTYRKFNPAQAPIMVLALTSDVLGRGELYDRASSIIAQKLSQVSGVGQIQVGGSSLPAVRVALQPKQLEQYGLSLDQVRQAITGASVRKPKGAVETAGQHWQIGANEQLLKAADYRPLIIRQQDGAILRLSDVAVVSDGTEDRYNAGLFNDQQSVLLVINRQAGANIIETIRRIKAELPALQAILPASMVMRIVMDRSPSIKATLHEAEITLLIAVGLVVVLVLLFLGRLRSALIPALAVPVSLVGTFAVMYLLAFSLNTLSLMALILAAGLVVDDAIVVMENIARHIDDGMPPRQAADLGSREVGFTLLSMNVSLVAVFVSILFMGGIVERLFFEFSITLAAAILVSLLVSLTLTPMLCARWLRPHDAQQGRNALQQACESAQQWMLAGYARSLGWALDHRRLTLTILLLTIAGNVLLYVRVPKAFLPQQDTGQLTGFARGDDGMSFQVMQPKLEAFRKVIMADPAVESVAAYIGGQSGVNNAFMMIRLKPRAQRDLSADKVIERIRRNQPKVPGARMFLMADQDLQLGGGRQSSSQYAYNLLSDDLEALRIWLPRVIRALKALPELTSIDANEGEGAQQVSLKVDRAAARRLGVEMSDLTSLLNNAFSQRQVATIYQPLNQYKVVMEIDPAFARYVSALDNLYLVTDSGEKVPVRSFARYEFSLEEDRVKHEGQFAAENIDFDLAPGVSLETATRAIERAVAAIGLPENVQGRLGGTASAFKSAQQGQPLLILGALVLVYIVLGVLYESYVHPLTILSTLPSAGVGALLAILLTGQQFSLISLLGLFLLIGIVKKNAIMMIDLALHLERQGALSSEDAIRRACLLRFRPILMTTLAAILGALPLLLGGAEGSEIRQPLGLAVIGGLLLSQLLTLYTTPVVYLYFDSLGHRFKRWRGQPVMEPVT